MGMSSFRHNLARSVPSLLKASTMKMLSIPVREIRLGFCGADDRVVSLNVPAGNDHGRHHPFLSFDLEYDSEQPDMIAIRLLEADQDNFIHTVQRSISFPVTLLAELVSRREATSEEREAWLSMPDDEE
jgi:hypothetical protein